MSYSLKYPIVSQFHLQNVRAIIKERQTLLSIQVPVDRKFPNGRQRKLTQPELDLMTIRRTSAQYSIKEHSAAAEQLKWSINPELAEEAFRNRIRKGINLQTEIWPDAEVLDHPYVIQDLSGKKAVVFRVQFAMGEAAAQAAAKSAPTLEGWKNKITRYRNLAVNPRRVKSNIERYEKEILRGGNGNIKGANKRVRRGR